MSGISALNVILVGNAPLFRAECSTGTKSDIYDKVFGKCSRARRADSKHAVFKKLEKVGEPYAEGNSIVSERMFQKYRTYEKNFFLNERDLLFTSYGDIVSIEIKQNQEDMEEKYSELTDIVHEYMDKDMTYKDFKEAINDWVDDYVANKESDKPTLKPFDLQQAKDGKPVCTRDGRKSRIICFDVKAKKPIAALITNDDTEEVHFYYDNGRSDQYQEYRYDLMMLPEKKEGWVNVMKGAADKVYVGNDIYRTEDEAKEGTSRFTSKLIASVPIEWEE